MIRTTIFVSLLAAIFFISIRVQFVKAEEIWQQPTVNIPTVTGTPIGVEITVNADQEQINVRSGPGTNYPQVGVLIAGQRVPALGRTPGGDWIKIEYAGAPGGVAWVYSFLVGTPSGILPIVEPPPTPTPRTTPTVDPTLAAEFVFQPTQIRVPTFTPPPPLVIPTFANESMETVRAGVPMGYFIVGLVVLGVFGMFLSLLRGR